MHFVAHHTRIWPIVHVEKLVHLWKSLVIYTGYPYDNRLFSMQYGKFKKVLDTRFCLKASVTDVIIVIGGLSVSPTGAARKRKPG